MSISGGAENGVQVMVADDDPSSVTEVKTPPDSGGPDPDNPMRFVFKRPDETGASRLGSDGHTHPRQGERNERDLAVRRANDRVNQRNLYPSRPDYRHMNASGVPMFMRNPAGAVAMTYRIDNVDHTVEVAPADLRDVVNVP
jgi:hypothetical protein